MSPVTVAQDLGKRGKPLINARVMCVEMAIEQIALLQRENERDESLIHALLAFGNDARIQMIVHGLCQQIKQREPRINEAREIAAHFDKAKVA